MAESGINYLIYTIIGGVIVAVVGVIIAPYWDQIANGPQTIPVTAIDSSTLCTDKFSLPSGDGYYSVSYLNQGGSPGNFALTLSSQDILSKPQNSINQFESNSNLEYNLDAHSKPTPYNFELNVLNPTNPPANIELDFKMNCSHNVAGLNLSCGSVNNICKYSRDTYGFYNLTP